MHGEEGVHALLTAVPVPVPSPAPLCGVPPAMLCHAMPCRAMPCCARSRSWGPMNMLTYLGLRQYAHLPGAQRAMAHLAALSWALAVLYYWYDGRTLPPAPNLRSRADF